MGSSTNSGIIPPDLQLTADDNAKPDLSPCPLDGSEPLHTFVGRQIVERLERLVTEAHRAAAAAHDEEAIHDLRVSMRRFSQGLILFPDFLPEMAVKQLRRKIKAMMNLTSEVRNRDIALEHLAADEDENLKARLRAERERCAAEFQAAIADWTAVDLAGSWRRALNL